MTTVHIVELGSTVPQPWRNGGGTTRELLAWPAGAPGGWLVRVSVADIDRDGPFSAFPGVQRGFVVLEGAGVLLDLGAGGQRLTPASPPLLFDGAQAPGCRLIDGPTRDLNLMAPHAAGQAGLQALADGEAWTAGAATRWRGVYSATPARLSAGDGEAVGLRAGSLAWSDEPAALASAWCLVGQGPQALRAWGLTLACSAPPGHPDLKCERT
jgi:hypothetical protein